MSDVAIRVEGLSKQYRIGGPQASYKTLRESVVGAARAPIRRAGRLLRGEAATDHQETIWALKDVSFEVKHGEVLGIIGRNGAGKSTLLKVLSRITAPTEGTVDLYGRVGSLLEVGTGFHPELTGRENIYLNGAILGMKRAEIDQKFDEIVAFAELEKFLDTPVKHYSSGMYVRLAFAVAAHLDPEILLVDEVLAVGDAAFQKKCLGKMGEVAGEGRTVLFVSHNMGAVENLCSRSLLLSRGSNVLDGSSQSVVDYYLTNLLPYSIDDVTLAERTDRSGNGRVRLTSFHIEDPDGNKLAVARSGMDVVFAFGFQCPERNASMTRNVDMGFSLHSDRGQTLVVLYSSYVGQAFETIPHEGIFRACIQRLPLSKGHYRVGARVTANGEEADWPRDGVGYLEVEGGDYYGTGREGLAGNVPFLMDGSWTVENGAINPDAGS